MLNILNFINILREFFNNFTTNIYIYKLKFKILVIQLDENEGSLLIDRP